MSATRFFFFCPMSLDYTWLGSCGGYRFGRVLHCATSLCYWFDLRTTSGLYTLRKLWKNLEREENSKSSIVVCGIAFKNDQNGPKLFEFSPFPRVIRLQSGYQILTHELKVFGRLQFSFLWNLYIQVLTPLYHHVLQHLRMVLSYSPSGILKSTSESNQWWKKDQTTALVEWLQSTARW